MVRRLWLASSVSSIGDYIGLGALLFLAADQTGRALGAAVVLAVGVLPSLVTGLVAGPWLDRFHRGRSLAGLQLAGAAVVCLPLLLDGVAIVFVTAALLAIVRIGTIAVRAGAMAEGIEDRHRAPLVALLASTDQVAQVVGYLSGGALYVLLGVEAALVLDAASFLVGAAVLARLRLPRPAARPGRPGLTAGLRDILADPVLRLFGALVVVTGTVASLPETLAPAIAGPADALRPLLLAVAPAGQALAMAFMGRLAQVHRPAVQLTHFTGLGIALSVALVAPTAAAFVVVNLLVGAGTGWVVGPQATFLRRAPATRMAQVTGTMVAALAVAEGIGTLMFAAVADNVSVAAAYGLAGGLLLAVAALGWGARHRTEEVRRLDRGWHGAARQR